MPHTQRYVPGLSGGRRVVSQRGLKQQLCHASQRRFTHGGRVTQRGGLKRTRHRVGGTDSKDVDVDDEDGKRHRRSSKKKKDERKHNPTNKFGMDRFLVENHYDEFKYDANEVGPNDNPPYPAPVTQAHLDHSYTHEETYNRYFVPYLTYYETLKQKIKYRRPHMSKEEVEWLDLTIDVRLREIRKWCGLEIAKVTLPPHTVYKDETHIWYQHNFNANKFKEWWKNYSKDNDKINLKMESCNDFSRVYRNLRKILNEAENHHQNDTSFHGLQADDLEKLIKSIQAIITHLKTNQCPKQAKEVDVPKLATRLQVLEADRRQLLMLLCGNVPATLLVDKRTGYIRRPKQICHHIQFLLRRHRMTNSSVGRYTKILTSTLRAGRLGAMYMTMLVAWTGLLLATMGILMGAVYMFHGTRLNRFIRRRVIYGIFKMVIFAWRVLMHLLDKLLGTGRPDWTYHVHKLRGNPSRDTDALLQWMTSIGFVGVIHKVLNSWKVDMDKTRRVTALRFMFQKINDQWSLLKVSHYIAQSQTGLFGEDSASGLTDAQMGLMYKVQKALKELDEEIDLKSERTVDQSNYNELLDEFGSTYKSGNRQRLCIELHNAYQRAQTHALNPRHFRAKMLKDYEHEFRAHHFFNSYGEPRSVLHIVLAYLLCWRREKMNTVLPTVPYKGRELVDDYMNPMNLGQLQERREHVLKGEWWQMNPIQCSEWARLHASDPLVAEERTVDNMGMYTEGPATARDYEEERHTKETEAYRQHLNLDYLFKNEKGYDGWIQAKLGRSEVAMNKFRNISGWTHRVSDALLARVNQQFEVMNANDATDYKRWHERQVMGRDRASVNVDSNYHVVMHGEALAESGLFTKEDAGIVGGQVHDEFAKMAKTLLDNFKRNQSPSLTHLKDTDLFTSSYPQFAAYTTLRECIHTKQDETKAGELLLYWCGFYAMSAESYHDDKSPGKPSNPFREHPYDPNDSYAKLQMGYSKVLMNRLGGKGVMNLLTYFNDCKFIDHVKTNLTDKYLADCIKNMRYHM